MQFRLKQKLDHNNARLDSLKKESLEKPQAFKVSKSQYSQPRKLNFFPKHTKNTSQKSIRSRKKSSSKNLNILQRQNTSSFYSPTANAISPSSQTQLSRKCKVLSQIQMSATKETQEREVFPEMTDGVYRDFIKNN